MLMDEGTESIETDFDVMNIFMTMNQAIKRIQQLFSG
jgi:hypothetical protein